MAGTTRIFGVVLSTEEKWEPVPDRTPLVNALKQCGAEPKVIIEGAGGDSNLERNAMMRMTDAGVTSIICMCADTAGLASAASSQGYYPEWLLSSFAGNDLDFRIRLMPGDQAKNVFGVTFIPRNLRIANDPPEWATREAAPDDPNPHAYNDATFGRAVSDLWYRDLLLLASGIQMAGPRLTPDTFEYGLQRTRFPNPDTPLMAGKVGFNGGIHSMTQDGAEMWWNPSAEAPEPSQRGSFCYVDHGARHSQGRWPAGGDPFFQGECDSV